MSIPLRSGIPTMYAVHLARVRVLFVALADEVRALEHVLVAREQAMLAYAERRQGPEVRSEVPTESGKRKSLTAGARRAGTAR